MGTDTALRRTELAAYSAGSLGTGVFSTVPTVLLLYFCTDVLRLDPRWAAVIVFVPKLWAIVWDPFVGAWSDRTVSRIGRRRPFLLAGALGVALAFMALFSPPALGTAGLLAWMGASYFGMVSLYSLFAVPYVAIPAQIGQSGDDRRRLVAWRMTVAMIGVLLGAGAAPLLVQASGGGRGGYAAMAVMVAAICGLAMIAPVFMLRGRDRSADGRAQERPSLRTQFGLAFRHRGFRRLTLSYVVQLTGISMVSAAAPYLVVRAFGQSEAEIGVALSAMLIATTVSIPLWASLGRRLGERRALAAAALGLAVAATALGLAALFASPWALTLVLFAALGLPLAGLQLLPYSLAAHLVHAQTQHSGESEGVFTGVWTAAEKLGLALGPVLIAWVLAMTDRDGANGLSIALILLPATLMLCSLPLLSAATNAATPLPDPEP